MTRRTNLHAARSYRPRRTYRERRLAKAERLNDWAESRDRKAAAAAEASDQATAGIPMGQPILVGHHSQRRHERAIQRAGAKASESVEHSRKASEMRSRAAGIVAAADAAIYQDDPDAIERLREKVTRLEAEREEKKQRNAAFRKKHRARLQAMSAYERSIAVPHPAYELSNLGGTISRTRQRLARLEAEQEGGR